MADHKAQIEQDIELNPQRPGLDRARLKDSGVSVWALISYLKYAARGDIARVAADYDVPVESVEAALAYYEQHSEAIDARIAANTPGVNARRHAA
jgi:uncharacterized protein (DUF433 family)